MEKKLIKKFTDKYSEKVLFLPNNIIEEWNKNFKNKKIFSFKKLNKSQKETIEALFIILKNTFSKLFFENESMKSLKTQIIGPFYLNLRKKDWYISFLKGNKLQLKNCFPYAMYNKKKKTFYWLKNIDTMCKHFFEDLPFCKYNAIKDIDLFQSDSLALWFRTMWYAGNWRFPDNKNWKTFNLILFELEFKNEIYVMYTLSDYGIKDPKHTDEIDGAIGLLRLTPTILKNSIKSKKGGGNQNKSHRIL